MLVSGGAVSVEGEALSNSGAVSVEGDIESELFEGAAHAMAGDYLGQSDRREACDLKNYLVILTVVG